MLHQPPDRVRSHRRLATPGFRREATHRSTSPTPTPSDVPRAATPTFPIRAIRRSIDPGGRRANCRLRPPVRHAPEKEERK